MPPFIGTQFNDILNGGGGADIIIGKNGDDILRGFGGTDVLSGDNGRDTLTGGLGQDFLTGGKGNDTFDYNAVNESIAGFATRDLILDFAGNGAAVGDVIDLSGIDANVGGLGNQAFTFTPGPGGAGTLWYVTPGDGSGYLRGNIDGDATVEFSIELVGAPALSVGGPGTDIIL